MERRVWLVVITLVSLAALLGWPLATSASHAASGGEQAPQTTSHESALPESGVADAQDMAHVAYLPIIVTSPPAPTPTPTATATPTSVATLQMIGYNVRCQTSGAVQVCAAVCSPYPAPYSTLNVYGTLFVNGVAQKNRPMTARFDFQNGPVTCSTATDWTGLAVCMQDLGAVPRYRTVNVHVTISGYSADTFFTPQ